MMENDNEFPEYAILYSKNARKLRDALLDTQRTTLIEIEDKLTNNPDKYPECLIPLDQNLFIYKHKNPAFEITYRIDRDEKKLYFLHLVAPKLEVSKKLFISYSHKDEPWLLELKKWLKPLEQQDMITIWDDQKLKSGQNWRNEIKMALKTAKAAVLLVSQDFVTSDFIMKDEIPELEDAVSARGLTILWIALTVSTVEDTNIIHFQAVHKDPPLEELNEAERKKQFLRIYQRIKEAVEAH